MSTSQQFLVCDSSTLANFKQWAQAISSWFATAGWSQSTDTGQVNWSTIVSVPGAAAYVFEIWQPNDGLTNFYLKVEYGNVSGTNCPTVRLSIGATTNGAGTLTGTTTSAITTAASAFTAPSTTTQFECDFSGGSGRIGAMMWRNGTGNCQSIFAVERSVDSTGAYTSSHVTIVVGGGAAPAGNSAFQQQTYIFGVGAGPTLAVRTATAGRGLIVRVPTYVTSTAFSNSISFDTVAPLVAGIDYNLTMIGAAIAADFVEGVTFTVTVYGSTRTYMPSALGTFVNAARDSNASGASGAACCVCLRYD